MPESKQEKNQFVIGIDFGQKRIGLAIGQTLTRTANPLTTINNDGTLWHHINQHISEWNASDIVLGLPLDMSGEEQEITRQVKNFGKKITQKTKLPIHFVDERLTSYAAERQFKESREANLSKAKDKAKIDAMAAQMILQSWFDQQHTQKPPQS